MGNSVICVNNVSKRYRIGFTQKKPTTFTEQIIDVVKSPINNFKRLTSLSSFHDDDESVFWALQEINFNVEEGEVLGLIGHNGAGKSTLLKLLSRITEPTTGEIRIKGRIAALLEVGTGFHQELTGRENVYMNGTILGMSRREIDKKFDEIVNFSGVEKFIDTPVKFYSSGMKIRLGFAVAAHLEPEILIVDEVLAVGDIEFQKRCLGKMDEVANREGRTILFVSHNMAVIRALCKKAILLKSGTLVAEGGVEKVSSIYLKGDSGSAGEFDFSAGSSRDSVVIQKVILKNQDGLQTQDFDIGDDLVIELYYYSREKVFSPFFFIGIKSKFGPLCGASSLLDGHQPAFIEGYGLIRCTFKNLSFLPQQYMLYTGVKAIDGKTVLSGTKDIGFFNITTVVSKIGFNGLLADNLASDSAPVLVPYSWQFGDDQVLHVHHLLKKKDTRFA